MGMYTELRGSILFKNEKIAKVFSESPCDEVWDKIAEITKLKEVADFVLCDRSHWIPHSGDGVKFIDGKIVQFHCELKNYSNTIEKFIELLPLIADKWALEDKYEEMYNWTLHRNDEVIMHVNGDNTHDMDNPFTKQQYTVYLDFDVFDLNNLK